MTAKDPLPTLSKMAIDGRVVDGANLGDEEEPHTQKGEQIINPWEVTAADEYGVDYDKLVEKFGTRKISLNLLQRFEKLTGRKPHRYLRRGHFFSER